MTMRTAIQAGRGMLYHYQAPNLAHIANTLLNNQIKFSDPHTFNDPWDCRPCFSKAFLDNPEARERHVQYAIDVMRRHKGIPEPELKRRADILRKDRAFIERRVDEITEAAAAAIREKYRVYCLSAVPDSFLMWAYYTGSHQGVCMGFTTRCETFCGALEVNYVEDYPAIDITESDEAALTNILLTKASAWKHESEFRLVAKEGTSEGFLTVKDGIYEILPTDLKVVIVGCCASNAHVASIKQILSERKHPVQLLAMRPVRNRYVLEPQGI